MGESLVIVSKEQMLHRICGEYLEMPGLRLTLRQAQRLWGLDAATCTQLLQSLIDQRFLCRRADGSYARLADGTERAHPMRMAKANIAQATHDRHIAGSRK